MENKPKKSKALIITIILIIILLLIGYLVVKNRDAFGVKTSNSIAKIFNLLPASENSGELEVIAQVGEDVTKGDSVSVFGTGSNNNPIVVKTSTNNGEVYGYAGENIRSGDTGKIITKNNKKKSNNFWNSFANFMSDIWGEKDTNPQCSDEKDNDGDGEIDKDDPNCHVDGDINKDYVPTHYSESSNPIDNGNGDPDLTASIVMPKIIMVNTETNLSSMITNRGGGSTNTSFSSFFTINTKGENEETVATLTTTVPTINGWASDVATVSYNFSSIGEYWARACADKSSSSDLGTITESNNSGTGEDNNCGPWTTITVKDSPAPCTYPQIKDTESGDCIDECLSPKVVIDGTCSPPPGNSCTIDGFDASSTTIANGESTYLSWHVNYDYCKSVSFSPDFGNTSLVGSRVPVSPTNTTTYTLRAYDLKGMLGDTKTVTIRVDGIPQPCDPPKITDTESGNCINTWECLSPKVVIGDTCTIPIGSSCKISDFGSTPTLIAKGESSYLSWYASSDYCKSVSFLPDIIGNNTNTVGSNVKVSPTQTTTYTLKAYDFNGVLGDTKNTTVEVNEINICLDIPPLTFTPEEKARLAVLLRKFYLISSTLRTTEDITTIYNEIDQQKNFVSQIEGLTTQCEDKITPTMMSTYGWERHGNPWYTDSKGGTFPYTSAITGYLDSGNQEFDNTERILNIW